MYGYGHEFVVGFCLLPIPSNVGVYRGRWERLRHPPRNEGLYTACLYVASRLIYAPAIHMRAACMSSNKKQKQN